jgi:polyvinyl alcohol dehydrogenase (cytochrome)
VIRRAAVATALSAAAALPLALPATAGAVEQQAYAAALNYATPALIAARGDTLRFNNLDAVAPHDIVSDQPGQFASALIAGGQNAPVKGVELLAPGSYAFHCSIHSWMHGALTVAAASGTPAPPGTPAPSGPGAPTGPNPVDLVPKVAAAALGPGDWPLYGHDLSNTRDGGSSGPSYNEVPTLGPAWSFASTDGDFTGTPVVAGGVLVAAAGGGTVYALDAASGKLRWKRDLNQPINGTAALSGGRVFVPLAKPGAPALAALRASDGALLWQTVVDRQANADIYGSPVVWTPPGSTAAKRVLRVHRHRRHIAHRARRGGARGAPRARRSAATAARELVFVGVSAEYGEVNDPNVNVRGAILALDAATGRLAWKTYTVPPRHDGGAVWNTPAIDTATGVLYAGTGNAYHAPAADTTDSVLAVDTRSGAILRHLQATGKDVWNGTQGRTNGPDYDFGASPNLLAGADGRPLVGEGQKSGAYWAFDRRTLTPAWTAVTGAAVTPVGGILGSTAFDGTRVYGADTPGGEVWALGRSGGLQWASADGDGLHFSSTAVANGVVYSTTMGGSLTARDASTGVLLAQLPLGSPSWGGVAIAGGSVFAVTGTQGTGGYVVSYRARG